ncbi:MAG: biotin--[acetyl-CoA-carboxylase] ligase [Treponema sp.]|nr:biotin--[acetyl-CoA-carboxylase] ligase [Treponema sp.]
MKTKEKVLQILQENINQAVSGEKLAAACNVSRAAIWKAVTTLRDTGYEINGTTNGGYIFTGNEDIFSKEDFCKYLKESYPNLKSEVETFEVIDSTNTYAKKLISQAGSLKTPDGQFTDAGLKLQNKIIVTESQTAGKGRLGRTFVSPAKTGIYISMIIIPEKPITDPALLTTSAAVAVCRVLKKIYNINPQIKWINDIFANGKKLCGILTEGFTNFETRTIDSAVIGIGINVKENPYLPDDVKAIATSIQTLGIEKINRCQLAAMIGGETLNILQEDSLKVMAEYKALSCLIDKEVTVFPIIGDQNSAYTATVMDIDENASLIVKTGTGEIKKLNSGEVSLKSANLTFGRI